MRILPHNGSFIVVPEVPLLTPIGGVIASPLLSPRYSKKSKKSRKYRDYLSPSMAIAPVPPFSPVLSPVFPGGVPGMPVHGVPVLSPGYVVPGLPGTYIMPSPAPATGATTPPATGATTPPATGATTPPATGATTPPTTPPATSYTVITPPITNIRHLTNPDQDPELRRKVVKHFYNQLKDVYFLGKFQNLLKYIVVENNKPRLVKSFDELQKNSNNNNDFTLRIKFITENIFSKYDLEVLISKLIAKYGMLYSEDEYNMHWHNAKYKHAKLVKKAMYKKIKYRLQKKVNF